MLQMQKEVLSAASNFPHTLQYYIYIYIYGSPFFSLVTFHRHYNIIYMYIWVTFLRWRE